MFRKLTVVIRQLLGRLATDSSRHSGVETNLQYGSVEDWMIGENVPVGFINEPDPVLRDKYIRQYGELRRHLFAQHVATLSPADQQAIKDGCHPSQSHQFADDAQPYCEFVKRHLISRGLHVSDVYLGQYHLDRIVLTVETTEQLDPRRLALLPMFFQGFEIKYLPAGDV